MNDVKFPKLVKKLTKNMYIPILLGSLTSGFSSSFYSKAQDVPSDLDTLNLETEENEPSENLAEDAVDQVLPDEAADTSAPEEENQEAAPGDKVNEQEVVDKELEQTAPQEPESPEETGANERDAYITQGPEEAAISNTQDQVPEDQVPEDQMPDDQTPGDQAQQNQVQEVKEPHIFAQEPPQTAEDQAEVASFYKEGIDTIGSQESGNWFVKRRIWRKAKPLYEKIRELVIQMESYQEDFFEKRAQLAQEINTFLLEVGITTGQAQEAFDELSKEIESKREVEGLDDRERELLVQLEANRADLEELKENFDILIKLNNVAKEVVSKVLDEVQSVQSYEQRAYNAYKQIGEILGHKEANMLYSSLENILENVQLKNGYIENDLNQYLNKNSEDLKALMSEIKNQVDDLKQRRVILKQDSLQDQKESKEKAEQEKQTLEKKHEEDEKAKAAESEAAQPKKVGWLSKLSQSTYSFYDSIKSWFSRFTSSKSTAQKDNLEAHD